jgi:hypothetical protein
VVVTRKFSNGRSLDNVMASNFAVTTDTVAINILRCTPWGIPQNIVVIRPGIMHQHAEFPDLVDVLAVDFEIVDGLADG